MGLGLLLCAGALACGSRTALDVSPGYDRGAGDDADGPPDGDGGGVLAPMSCSEYCDQLQDCDSGNDKACRSDCPRLMEAITESSWIALYADCIRASCKQNICQERAIESTVPESYQLEFCDFACGRSDVCGVSVFVGGICVDECLWGHWQRRYPLVVLSRPFVSDLRDCFAGDCAEMASCFERVSEEWLPTDCLAGC